MDKHHIKKGQGHFQQLFVSHKLLFLGHHSLIKNKTQTAVINIVNKRILINLTFRMLVNTHFQKYKLLQCLKTVYIVYNKGWNREFEQDNVIPFLDILVKRCPDKTFVTSIYRKKTFTGLYTTWDSFTPRKYKINLIRMLTYRCFRICSSASLLQSALNDLKKLLLQNGYPQGVITYNINDVLNRNKNKPNDPVVTVPKKDIIRPVTLLRSSQQSSR